MIQTTFFILLTAMNILGGGGIFLGLLGIRMRQFPRKHRILLGIGALGLFAQAARNIVFLKYGQALSDNEIPLWALKDISIAGIAILYLITRDQENP